MKSKEELNALKKEVKTANNKYAELSDEDLLKVVGGVKLNETGYYICKKCGAAYKNYEVAVEHEKNCTNGSDGTSVLRPRTMEVD